MSGWYAQLQVARDAARLAGQAVRAEFGMRRIAAYKGATDVQLSADLLAQQTIASRLREAYPDYGLVAEEDENQEWPARESVWVVDPLDGSNNFGYGIAHCAVAVTLFHRDEVVLGLVFDPLLGREFYATGACGITPIAAETVPLDRATISIVTSYGSHNRGWLVRVNEIVGDRCKRLVIMWAPALDLALIASGSIDAMICYRGGMLDVCGGMFLVESAGGCVLDFKGAPVSVRGSDLARPLSFVAARTADLAHELVKVIPTR